MTAQEQAKRFAEAAPQLNKAEREELNDLFPAYIFRRNRTGEVWTTCCGQYRMLEDKPGQRAIRYAMHQREARNMYEEAPYPLERCPYCGKPVIIKELGRTGNRDNLCCWRRAMVLRWFRGALWGVCYDLRKEYKTEESLTEEPKRYQMAVYRFRPGKAEMVRRCTYDRPYTGVLRQDGPLTGGRWALDRPFYPNSYYGGGYDIVGAAEVKKSPFRYCQIPEARRHGMDFDRLLTACCFYPRQIEMLMKAGLHRVVQDLVDRGVKHQLALDWETSDPKQFFRIGRQEQKIFLASGVKNIQAVELYRKLRGKEPMEACCRWIREDLELREAEERARTWGTELRTILRYLDRNRGRVNGGTIRDTFWAWSDYLHAAAALDYPLHRENVLMPTPLGPAHEEATARHRERLQEEQRRRNERYRQLDEERRRNEEKQRQLAREEYGKRKEQLEKKYGYEADGYLIRVPENGEEIRQEGAALRHCVAGYADRHIAGTLTILFMRRAGKPAEPWLTIEMSGDELRQIHGYRNEGLYTAEGRFAPDPREEHRKFLDTWLAWLEAGSKRDKAGNPVLPKKKEDKIA